MSDPVFKENSVLIGGKYGDIQSFTNAQGGNATIIEVGGGGQMGEKTNITSTIIRKEMIITEQFYDPSENESNFLLEKNASPEILHKTIIVGGGSQEVRGGGIAKGGEEGEENYQKALILSGGAAHFQNCPNIQTCQDPSHLISMGGKMHHRETRETVLMGGVMGGPQKYSNMENRVIRMEGAEIGRGQVTTTTTHGQNNSSMMGGQSVYVGGGGENVYRENVMYSAGGENLSLVRGGGGMNAGYQTFQPMSFATASVDVKSHGGAGAALAVGGCKLTPGVCALLLCNIVFWAIILMLIVKEI